MKENTIKYCRKFWRIEHNKTEQNRTEQDVLAYATMRGKSNIIPSAPGGQMPCTGQPVKHKNQTVITEK